MEAVQVAASAVDLVRNLVLAVQALEQASRDMRDAPQKAEDLERMFNLLTRLHVTACQKYDSKLHHSELDMQLKSLETLLQNLSPQVKSAKKMAKRKGVKLIASAVLGSIVGDPLTKITNSMMRQLNSWLEMQTMTRNVQEVIETGASYYPSLLRVHSEMNYPRSEKASIVRELLDSQEQQKVILIHGLSGIGKSCLARQVAADPPKRFSDGAVELVLGQWCSRAGCGGNVTEYQKRLAVKFCRLLRRLGRKKEDFEGACLEDACYMLQETLEGKSLLVLLDDVWEPDIIDRFVKLYSNNCKYLATTRNEAVHEITGAMKLEIGKEDTRDLSRAILLHHSQLSESELPNAADTLITRCGHHPLTLAVMGKALRGETRPDQWEKAVGNLWMYAAQAPVPVPYLNEKEAENAATVFGSFEFSMEGMVPNARNFFIALAVLFWVEPIPEMCLEAVWSALDQDSTFLLMAGKLLERSLLGRSTTVALYNVHDMVALYLENKVSEAMQMVFMEPVLIKHATVAPWLFIFGKKNAQKAAEETIKEALYSSDVTLVGLTLTTIVHVVSASKSISELEATSISFSRFVGLEVPRLLLVNSKDLTKTIVRYIANCFTLNDYIQYGHSLESAGLIDELVALVKRDSDIVQIDSDIVQIEAVMVLTRLMELRNVGMGREVLHKMPVKELVGLLDPMIEERQDTVLNALLSLAKAGKEEAIDQIFMAGMDRKLLELLTGTEATQSLAIAALKSFHELGGSHAVNRFLRSAGNWESLPWKARLVVEKLANSDKHPIMPARYSVDLLVGMLQDGSERQQIEAMQDLVPIIEKVENSQVREMILQAHVVDRLAELLQNESADNRIRSEAAFSLMKLGCSGGEICIRQMLKANVIESLVSMMGKSRKELQDTAYSALHNLIGAGKLLITQHMLHSGHLENIVALLQYNSANSREIAVQCIQDVIEFGGKTCIERLLTLQVVEKLAVVAQSNARFKDVVINFTKGVEKCQGLSSAERNVFRQQLIRKVKVAVKNVNQLLAITAILQGSAEGSSRGGSSRSGSRKGGSSKSRSSGFGSNSSSFHSKA